MDQTTTTFAPAHPHSDPLLPGGSPHDGGGGGRRGGRGGGRALATGLAVLLLGFGGGVGGYYAADHWSGDDASTSSSASLQPSNESDPGSDGPSTVADDGTALTPRQVYSRVAPAVVHINSETTETQTGFFGIPQTQKATGTGSGFVIDSDGHIVTNAHVVENSSKLTVSFGTDITVPAKLVGLDKSTDIAVIKIDPDAKEVGALRTVQFGDSQQVHVGDPVLAIGNPFSLDRTLTTGVVSALQRDIPSLNDFTITGVIQTDAAVNPGNSGGPLLNTAGRVIGVNSQIQSKGGGFDGIAFAVPSSTAKRVADELIANGSVKHAWLGVSGKDLTPEIADALNIDAEQGVIIGTVADGSPAAKAGIDAGSSDMLIEGIGIGLGADVLVEFDGTKLASMQQLVGLVDAHDPGDEVEAVFLHKGDRKTTKIKLGTRPDTSTLDSSSSNDQ